MMTKRTAATRGDGAAVGLAIGLAALAIALASGELWLAAAVPAGLVAGAAVGPRVSAGGRIGASTVVVAGFVATITGDGAIALVVALDPERIGGLGLHTVEVAVEGWTLGLISAGWLAMPPLVVIAWAGCVILRRRVSRSRPKNGERPETPRTAWVAGLVVGCAAGLLSLSIPVVGWELAVAFAIGALLNRGTAAACGGLLVAAGATWSAVLLRANSQCATHASAFDSCVAPDLGPWFAVGFGMLLAGAILTAASVATTRPARSRSS